MLFGSEQCIGLYTDGSAFLGLILERGWFLNYDEKPRDYTIWMTQVPVVVALRAGVTDLHWLARLYSFGTLVVPAAFYSLALVRARSDTLLLAFVAAAIGAFFLTCWLCAVGEYNTCYAVVTAAAVFALSKETPRLIDGIVLVLLGVISLRCYEAFVYLGPVLAVILLWRTPPFASQARAGHRSLATRALYVVAAGLFVAGIPAAIASVGNLGGLVFVRQHLGRGFGFWRNPQTDLALAALALMLLAAALRRTWPAICCGVALALLALMPVLQMNGWVEKPLVTQHYESRMICSLLLAGLIGLAWLWPPDGGAGERRLVLPFALIAAMLPSNVYAVAEWGSIVDVVHSIVRGAPRDVELGDAPAEVRRLFWLPDDQGYLSTLSQMVRSTPADHLLRLPYGQFSEPLLNIGAQYVWRD